MEKMWTYLQGLPPGKLWRYVLAVSVLIRVGLLAFGEWQDRNMAVKFTDVDYRVFTDAAQHVLEGRSPYARATYRYTPLLAYLMVFNLTVHECVGKVMFALLDLAVGWFIQSVLKLAGSTEAVSVLSSCAWLFNPLTVAVSTRGNAESLLAVIVLSCLWLLYKKHTIAAGLMLGVATHCKLFPVIYALPMFLFIDQGYGARPLIPSWSGRGWPKGPVSRFLRPQRLVFAVSAAVSFLALSAWMYHWYGHEFLHETYLYHFIRKDNRHNFSLYFYPLYLTWRSRLSSLLSLAAFLPQAVLLLVSSVVLYRDVALCCFVVTFIFVTFNKVCTSQYFIWYLCLLPLILPNTRLSTRRGCFLVFVWGTAQALWLTAAYHLEFQGRNTFLYIWMASAIFFCSNAFILIQILTHSRASAVFPTPKKD